MRDLCGIGHAKGAEVDRQDANDPARMGVQIEHASNDLRVRGKAIRPQIVAQDDHRSAGWSDVFRKKRAAERHSDAESVEEFWADAHAAPHFGAPTVEEDRLRISEARHAVQVPAPRTPLIDRPAVHCIDGPCRRIGASDGDEPVGRGIRQLAQQEGFDHGKDGSVQTDSEHHRQKGNTRERSRCPERAEGKANILGQMQHVGNLTPIWRGREARILEPFPWDERIWIEL